MPSPRLLTSESAAEHLEYWRNQFPEPESFVYVIQAVGDSPIKVGKGDNRLDRLAAVQTGNPRPLRVLHVIAGDRRLEHHLHRRLGRSCRMVGEWFDGLRVAPFLDFVEDLARRMLISHEETKEMPRWWEFVPDYDLHQGDVTKPPPTLTIRHIAPDPVPEDEQQRRFERAFVKGDRL